jgi:hypothetical protein
VVLGLFQGQIDAPLSELVFGPGPCEYRDSGDLGAGLGSGCSWFFGLVDIFEFLRRKKLDKL